MSKKTQSTYDKVLVFQSIKGENSDKLANNWPFPEPKLNNQESSDPELQKLKKEFERA